MPSPYAPDTVDALNQIVAYLAAMTYPSTALVYTAGQSGRYKDLTDLLPANGTNAVYEVLLNLDDSKRHALGGTMRDTQSFYVLSMVDFTNGNTAETLIAQIRDAIMPKFAKHAALENAGNILLAKYKPNTGRFLNVFRAAKEYRAHVFELEITTQWVSQGGFIA